MNAKDFQVWVGACPQCCQTYPLITINGTYIYHHIELRQSDLLIRMFRMQEQNSNSRRYENSDSLQTVSIKRHISLCLSKILKFASDSFLGSSIRRVELCDSQVIFCQYTIFSAPFRRSCCRLSPVRPLIDATSHQLSPFDPFSTRASLR